MGKAFGAGGGIKTWWGSLLGEMSKFLASGGTLPQPPLQPPSRENPESGE